PWLEVVDEEVQDEGDGNRRGDLHDRYRSGVDDSAVTARAGRRVVHRRCAAARGVDRIAGRRRETGVHSPARARGPSWFAAGDVPPRERLSIWRARSGGQSQGARAL